MAQNSTIIQARYDATHTTRFYLKLNNKSDADIIEQLQKAKEGEGIQAYIKRLIRADIK